MGFHGVLFRGFFVGANGSSLGVGLNWDFLIYILDVNGSYLFIGFGWISVGLNWIVIGKNICRL